MIAIRASLLSFLICFGDGASIRANNDDTLEIFKNDISKVGSAIQNLTFDVLRNILENSTEDGVREEENAVKVRQIRATSDSEEFLNLCQKRCKEEYLHAQNLETQHIKGLKDEVQRLKEMVELLQNQQKIIHTLDTQENQNHTKTQTREKSEEDVPNNQQLAMIKLDLKEAIESLNQTKEFINLQKKRDAIMEKQLINQEEEIKKLKIIVSTIVNRNITNSTLEKPVNQTSKEENSHVSARASELSEIRKFLKNLHSEDDIDDSSDLRSKILQLEKQLESKKKQENLAKQLKVLEESLAEKDTPKDLMEQLMKALRRSELQKRSEDSEINNLEDLQRAINNLQPKEPDNTAQFQAMLSKLVNRSNQRPAKIAVTPQQMSELTKKLTPNNYPYICIVDDGAAKSNGYRVPVNSRNFQFYPSAPLDYSNQKGQFFPVPPPQQNYYPQANAYESGADKSGNYQPENVNVNRKYQEDLRSQIDGLQASIDTLNRPEYTQKAEDKAMINDLEVQITDLRNIVKNLNYDENRPKRSVTDNNVEDSDELIEQMKNLVGKMLDEDVEKDRQNFTEIQNQINLLKNQLDLENTKERASVPGQQDYNPNLYTNQVINPPISTVKSTKNDFFGNIVSKILDKLISVIPVVIEKLFHFSFAELTKTDYQDYDAQVLFKNLGIFAYLPVILLRLLKGVSAFMNMLRKNSFFKNFIMPAVILATVAGSVLFLIWWLQPDDYSQYQNNYVPYDPNPPPVSYSSTNAPVYSRNYYSQ